MRSSSERIAGIILAGGAGERIGGDKPHRQLLGKALIEHVIGRMQSQVGRLWISASTTDQRLESYGLPIVEDNVGVETVGPLAGFISGIDAAAGSGFYRVAVVPCDVPYLPPDLVGSLDRQLSQSNALGIVVSCGGQLQPTIGLWRTAALAPLRSVLAEGQRKLSDVCNAVGAASLDCNKADWPDHAFLNVNTASDMTRAEAAGEAHQTATTGSANAQ